MSSTLVNLGSLVAILLFLGAGIVRRRPLGRLGIYRRTLVASCLVWIAHAIAVTSTAAGWGDSEGAMGARWLGLDAYSVLGTALVLGLLVVAWWVAKRRPVLAAFLPLAVGVAAWRVLPKLLYWHAPSDFFVVDIKPWRWLAVASMATCVCLIGFAIHMQRHRAVHTQ